MPHPNQIPPPQKLPNIGAIVAVASGKGGVGKSTVAVNLACSLALEGHRVGLLDADIYGPSQHIMMGLTDQDPVINANKKILPIQKHGVFCMSFGFFTKAHEAVVWRGPMIARMFQQFINDVEWAELDYLILDLPPGTGDIQLTMSQILQVTGVVIVTTPQDVALADATKGVNMFRKVDVGIVGLIENMSYFTCPHCGKQSTPFSKEGGQQRASELGVPFLGSLPLEEETRETSDAGIPIVVKNKAADQAKRFMEIACKVRDKVEEIKKELPKTPTPTDSSESQSFSV